MIRSIQNASNRGPFLPPDTSAIVKAKLSEILYLPTARDATAFT